MASTALSLSMHMELRSEEMRLEGSRDLRRQLLVAYSKHHMGGVCV